MGGGGGVLVAASERRSGPPLKILDRDKPLWLFFLGNERNADLSPQTPDHGALFSDRRIAIDEQPELFRDFGGLGEKPRPARGNVRHHAITGKRPGLRHEFCGSIDGIALGRPSFAKHCTRSDVFTSNTTEANQN